MALETHTASIGSNNGNDSNNLGTDPWSDKTWGPDIMGLNFDNINTSQDALFPFAADPNADLVDATFDNASNASGNGFFSDETNLFRSMASNNKNSFGGDSATNPPPSSTSSQPKSETGSSTNAPHGNPSSGWVRVAVHEQVSALYDGVTDEPTCHVEGSIYVQPTKDLEAKPFLLVIRDLDGHVASWKDWPSTCQNVSDSVSRKGLHRSDRVLRITTKSDSERPHTVVPEDTLIAQYICTDRVRPVPLLIKSRVVTNHRYCRVGFKIRANPSNALPLKRVVLLLAVPPHIEGRTAKMSRKGGVWDELKRTISWVIPQIDPGEALEVQAQFEGPGTDGGQENVHAAPRFPILARGDYAESYSSVVVKKSEVRDGLSHPIHSLKINRSGRVIHRKV
ncbi:hypothetical protein ACA910_010300 [Epithemia clementina (nom. ined.)]